MLDFLRQYIPGARLVQEVGTEMIFLLPVSSDNQAVLAKVFADLEEHQDKLKIHKYGVSDSTLEEVFLKVTDTADRGEELDATTLKLKTLSDLAHQMDSAAEKGNCAFL